jgi:hypothetical protein
VLRGDAGIGKSALLDDARTEASDMWVLASVGVESETHLPYAGLHQLLRPVLGAVDGFQILRRGLSVEHSGSIQARQTNGSSSRQVS